MAPLAVAVAASCRLGQAPHPRPAGERKVNGQHGRGQRDHEAGSNEIRASKVSVPQAIMFCSASTGRMKPKLTTNCRSVVMPTTLTPGVWTPESTLMMIGDQHQPLTLR